MQDILDKAAKLKLVIFDVDGVLTDGSLVYGDDGQEYKAFNSRDGHGINMINKHQCVELIRPGARARASRPASAIHASDSDRIVGPDCPE